MSAAILFPFVFLQTEKEEKSQWQESENTQMFNGKISTVKNWASVLRSVSVEEKSACREQGFFTNSTLVKKLL